MTHLMRAAYTTKQGDMLDLIAWLHYGYHEGAVEAILAVNYRLSDMPHVLPIGMVILLLELPTLADLAPKPVRLWD
jgi:phage tail protein X